MQGQRKPQLLPTSLLLPKYTPQQVQYCCILQWVVTSYEYRGDLHRVEYCCTSLLAHKFRHLQYSVGENQQQPRMDHDAAAELVRVGHDYVMLSALNGLHVNAPPTNPIDAANKRGGVVTSNFEPGGVAGTSPYMVPRSTVGRDRARALPAWMTVGATVPGGLHQHVPLESDGLARVPQPTLYSSLPQQKAERAQQVDPNVDSFRLGIQTANKNKNNRGHQAAELSTSRVPGERGHTHLVLEAALDWGCKRTPTTAVTKSSRIIILVLITRMSSHFWPEWAPPMRMRKE